MKWKGRLADTGTYVEITAEESVIRSVTEIGEQENVPWISPGWIDLQVNGFAGFDFNGEVTTAEDVIGVTNAMLARGVTTYLPTVITGSSRRISQALTAIAEACDSSEMVGACVPGIHLEGPYLSEEDGPRGAHDKAYIRNPDWTEFAEWQAASGNRIRLVTIAPERDGAIPFIGKLAESGIVVSLGHTQATTEQIEAAVQAGAVLSTHLGNGSHPMLPRHPNYMWDQLANDGLWATFIPDGHHLAPNVLKAMLRAKREKAIFVSDCVKFGGMPPGRYESNIGSDVELHSNGRLTTAANPDILAGSAQSLDWGIAAAVQLAGISLGEAIEASTIRPATVMGFSRLGRLAAGMAANLTLFDYPASGGKLHVRETVLNGKTVYLDSRRNHHIDG
ncbi:N-acetylglucosamine-6-phosphate deacetylase [Paenibacillus whitsoniae]|uniref:N-acetylglucosamine-6-phosphate deacetylase n=1 Tax=Paenibacillus whitsoniae TaxID=2496558 RepID=A0A430JIC3_9BACL|nr:amidohydrolase family protein [Paenibacillus whitsoniae]RTE10789.1 N-acetylglucosamine-6-phosphate deacetylase [Paenibacillus whitsoniae]